MEISVNINRINRVCAVYFSATGTTKTIVQRVGEELAHEVQLRLGETVPMLSYDFTTPHNRNNSPVFNACDIVVLGVPVYAGRVPNLLIPFLGMINGNGALAVPIVLFGNRNFDDALIELRDIMEQTGFYTIAAGAFVGQHSFSEIIAAGRPDNDDINMAVQFAVQIIDKISKGHNNQVNIPGTSEEKRVYYQPKDADGNKIDIRKVKPLTGSNCNKCGVCVAICPMGAIDIEFPYKVTGICIKCGACIKFCPHKSKYFDDPGYIYHVRELEQSLQLRMAANFFM